MWSRYRINLLLLLLIGTVLVWAWISQYHQALLDTEIWHPPEWLQCLIPNISSDEAKNDCSRYINVDGWSLAHIFFFFLLGLIIPNYYGTVLVTSVLFEYAEYVVGQRARWLMDPLANLLGYAIGSLAFNSFEPLIEQVLPPSILAQTGVTILLSIILILVILAIWLKRKSESKLH